MAELEHAVFDMDSLIKKKFDKMEIKELSFEEWKNKYINVKVDQQMIDHFTEIGLDYNKEIESALKSEYQWYIDNFKQS